ncbi:MAG TPA: hypothetical protein VK099_02215 [Alcanivoracaceae bacterium]|nr:hypothetical protein [Alcanivoracaceae bacterium]
MKRQRFDDYDPSEWEEEKQKQKRKKSHRDQQRRRTEEPKEYSDKHHEYEDYD